MAGKGAPLGNDYAKRGAMWREAIRSAAIREEQGLPCRNAMERIARALLAKAEEGDVAAIKEFGDRMDGKAMQAVELKADVGVSVIERRIVRPSD